MVVNCLKDCYSIAWRIGTRCRCVPYCPCKLISSPQCQHPYYSRKFIISPQCQHTCYFRKFITSPQCQHPYCSRKADKSATILAKDWYSISWRIGTRCRCVPYCPCKLISSPQCQHPYCSRKADKSATILAKDWYSIAWRIGTRYRCVPYCPCKLISSLQCQHPYYSRKADKSATRTAVTYTIPYRGHDSIKCHGHRCQSGYNQRSLFLDVYDRCWLLFYSDSLLYYK